MKSWIAVLVAVLVLGFSLSRPARAGDAAGDDSVPRSVGDFSTVSGVLGFWGIFGGAISGLTGEAIVAAWCMTGVGAVLLGAAGACAYWQDGCARLLRATGQTLARPFQRLSDGLESLVRPAPACGG